MERPLTSATGLPGATPYGAEAYAPCLPEEADPDGGWLFSFVDILTVLVTLLALLLAYTYVPHPAQREAAASPPGRKTSPPAAHTPAPKAVIEPPALITRPQGPDTNASGFPPAAQALSGPVAAEDPRVPQAPHPPASHADDPKGARAELVLPPVIRGQVSISRTGNRINLAIKDDILFNVGSDRLTGTGTALLGHIARVLLHTRYAVSVEGHTDNTPIHTARFPSNWELSAARATNVTRYLIAQGIAAGRLRATGYGDTRPIADNDTAAGRARNRRVVLVLHLHRGARPSTAGGGDGRP